MSALANMAVFFLGLLARKMVVWVFLRGALKKMIRQGCFFLEASLFGVKPGSCRESAPGWFALGWPRRRPRRLCERGGARHCAQKLRLKTGRDFPGPLGSPTLHGHSGFGFLWTACFGLRPFRTWFGRSPTQDDCFSVSDIRILQIQS